MKIFMSSYDATKKTLSLAYVNYYLVLLNDMRYMLNFYLIKMRMIIYEFAHKCRFNLEQ